MNKIWQSLVRFRFWLRHASNVVLCAFWFLVYAVPDISGSSVFALFAIYLVLYAASKIEEEGTLAPQLNEPVGFI